MVMNNYEPLLEKWSKYLASKKVPKYAQAYQFDIPGDLIYNFYNISKKMPEEWEISEFEDIYQTCVNTQNNTKSLYQGLSTNYSTLSRFPNREHEIRSFETNFGSLYRMESNEQDLKK